MVSHLRRHYPSQPPCWYQFLYSGMQNLSKSLSPLFIHKGLRASTMQPVCLGCDLQCWVSSASKKSSLCGRGVMKYRVHIKYWRILQNHIFTNTEQKYVCYYHLKEECLQFHSELKCVRCVPHMWHGTQDMLERVWREWEYRLDICPVTGGAHIERT